MIQRLKRLVNWLSGGSDEKPSEEEGLTFEPVWIPEPLAIQTQDYLRTFCNDEIDREGLVYWAGIETNRGGVVTTLFVPDADAGPGYVKASPTENAEVITELTDLGLVLLGQAHSHPPRAGTRHSPGDERSFSPFEGALSVVAANYAREDVPDSWGLHRFINGEYRWIAESEWSDHLQIVPGKRDRRTCI